MIAKKSYDKQALFIGTLRNPHAPPDLSKIYAPRPLVILYRCSSRHNSSSSMVGCNRSDSPSVQPSRSAEAPPQPASAATASTTTSRRTPLSTKPAAQIELRLMIRPRRQPARSRQTGQLQSAKLVVRQQAFSEGVLETLSSKSDEKVVPDARDHYQKALELANKGQTGLAKRFHRSFANSTRL